jgi:hypothetical protein
LPTLFPEEICNAANYAITYVLEQIFQALIDDPDLALSTKYLPKPALTVDWDAEQNFRTQFRKYKNAMFREVLVYGEESISSKTNVSDKVSDKDGLVALVDMVDGTDLLERNLSNWCSAAVFFYPNGPVGKRIAAACVGLPSGKIYFTHEKMEKEVRFEKFDRHGHEQTISDTVGGKSSVTRLENASICFYGQKPASLMAMARTELFAYLAEKESDRKLKRKEAEESDSVLVDKNKENRIYTLSGIPMMMKLIDRQVPIAANIDAVIQLDGQHPHDAVPGLYIARHGDAFILNLKTEKEMTDEELEQGLTRPGHDDEKMTYIVASTPELCYEILPLLKTKNQG